VDATSSAGAYTLDALPDFPPDGFHLPRGADQLLPTIVLDGMPADPAISFHAIEDADECRWFQPHQLCEFNLCEFFPQCQPAEHLGLTEGDSMRSQFFIECALKVAEDNKCPVADTGIHFVFEHTDAPKSLAG
jgi:hypothetical protein